MSDKDSKSTPLLSQQVAQQLKQKTPSTSSSSASNGDSDGSSSSSSGSSWDGMNDAVTDDQLIRLSVLSQIVERYRFLIPSARVDDVVNEASLHWMFELDQPHSKRTSALHDMKPPSVATMPVKTQQQQQQQQRQDGNNGPQDAAPTSQTRGRGISFKDLVQKSAVMQQRRASVADESNNNNTNNDRRKATAAASASAVTTKTGSSPTRAAGPSFSGLLTAMKLVRSASNAAGRRRTPLIDVSTSDEDVPPPISMSPFTAPAPSAAAAVSTVPPPASSGNVSSPKKKKRTSSGRILDELNAAEGASDGKKQTQSRSNNDDSATSLPTPTKGELKTSDSGGGVAGSSPSAKAVVFADQEQQQQQQPQQQQQANSAPKSGETILSGALSSMKTSKAGGTDQDSGWAQKKTTDDFVGVAAPAAATTTTTTVDSGGPKTKLSIAGAVTALRLVNNAKRQYRKRRSSLTLDGEALAATGNNEDSHHHHHYHNRPAAVQISATGVPPRPKLTLAGTVATLRFINSVKKRYAASRLGLSVALPSAIAGGTAGAAVIAAAKEQQRASSSPAAASAGASATSARRGSDTDSDDEDSTALRGGRSWDRVRGSMISPPAGGSGRSPTTTTPKKSTATVRWSTTAPPTLLVSDASSSASPRANSNSFNRGFFGQASRSGGGTSTGAAAPDNGDGAVVIVGKTVKAVGGFAVDTILALKDGVRDTVKVGLSNVKGVAVDLGFVGKDEHAQSTAELAAALWKRCRGVKATFRELLLFDCAHFPYSTEQQRKILRRHEEHDMVSREELAFDLQVEMKEGEKHPLLQCIFGELNELPQLVYKRVVSCVHEHPHKHKFFAVCARRMVDAKRSISLMMGTFIMFLLVLVIVPQLDINTMFRVQFASTDALNGEFVNGCPDGVTKGGCFFSLRTIAEVNNIVDMITYFRSFPDISELWDTTGDSSSSSSSSGSSSPAAYETFHGNVRVGSVVFKLSPLFASSRGARTNPNLLCPVTPCHELNLSLSLWEYVVSQEFSCDATAKTNRSTLVIPFNSTKAEASALAATWEPDLMCEDEDMVATINFAMFNPTSAVLTWSTASFVVTKGGSVVPRAGTQSMNLKAKSLVRAFAAVHLTSFVWLLLVVLFRRHEPLGRFFTIQMVIEYILTLLNIITLAMVESLPALDEILRMVVQATHVPPDVDKWVGRYAQLQDIMAWWVLLFFVSSTHVFSEVIGLSVLTRLLRVTAADVLCLLIIFTVIASAFLGIARCLFGLSTTAFSYSLSTTQTLLAFSWGAHDYEKLTEQSPVAATIFYFVFLTFISCLLLNILVAVITARLEDMRERANLHTELYSSMLNDAANFEGSERFWFNFRVGSLPLINVVVDALPLSGSTLRWRDFYRSSSFLYAPISRRSLPSVHDMVARACEIVEFCEISAPRNFTSNDQFWNTALRRAVETYDAIDDRVSWVFIERVILRQSTLSIVRDAALVKALVIFDETETDILNVLEFQKQQQQLCVDSRAAVAAGVTEKQQRFVDRAPELSRSYELSAEMMMMASSSKDDDDDDDDDGDPNGNNNNKKDSNGAVPQQTQQDASTDDDDDDDSSSDSGDGSLKKVVTLNDMSAALNAISTTTTSTADASGLNRSNSNNAKSSLSLDSTSLALLDSTGKLRKRRRAAASRSGNYKILARHQIFLVNQYIVRMIKAHLLFPLRSALALVLWAGFFFSLLLFSDSSSWLSHNLQQQMTTSEYTQMCHDSECKRGSTFAKTFSDIGHGLEVKEYLRRLYGPKIFPEKLPFVEPARFAAASSSSPPSSWPVAWDPTIRRTSPVSVRQIRIKREKCVLPPDDAFEQYGDARRTEAFKAMSCYRELSRGLMAGGYDTSTMPRPANSSLGEDAYVFKDECVESSLVLGQYDLYPCLGHTATVHNSTQLQDVLTWLDSSAALIVISATFGSDYSQSLNSQFAGRKIDVRLDLYVELLPGGGGANVFSFVSVSQQVMFASFSWVGFLMLAIDLLFFSWSFGRYLYYKKVSRIEDLASAEQHRPEPPVVAIITLIAVIWLASSTSSISPMMRQSWMLSVLVVSSTTSLCYYALFPLAKIITHRAAYLIRSMSLSLRIVLVILPFYAVAMCGFVVSGHVLFGRNVKNYSTLRLALQTIARGFLSDWSVDDISKERPLVAFVFSIVFFAIVLVTLSNLLLTLIVLGTSTAASETKIVSYIQQSAEYSNQRVFCDEFVAVWLAWHTAEKHPFRRAWKTVVQRARELLRVEDADSVKLRKMAAALQCGDRELVTLLKKDDVGGQFFVSPHGRFSRPLESLMFAMPGFFRLQELSVTLSLDSVDEWFLYSVSLFLARSQAHFQKFLPEQFALDDVEEAKITAAFRFRAESTDFSAQAAAASL